MTEIALAKDEIFNHISSILGDMFEIDEASITLGSSLYDDLDIDSIDAVDLIVELKKFTGKKIQPEDFKSVRTVEDVVEAVAALMAE